MATTLEGNAAMPPAPPALDAVTNARDQARPTCAPTPAAVPGGRGPRKAQMLPLRRGAGPPRPTVAGREARGSPRAGDPGNRPRRLAGLLGGVPENPHSYPAPLFDRPDLVENDYSPSRNYPSG